MWVICIALALVLIFNNPECFYIPIFTLCLFSVPLNQQALLVPFICSFNHASCDPLLTKIGRNVCNCIHSDWQVKPRFICVSGVVYLCAENELWCLSALHHFIMVHIPDLPLVFLLVSAEKRLWSFSGFTNFLGFYLLLAVLYQWT